jgi:hypothetical protein
LRALSSLMVSHIVSLKQFYRLLAPPCTVQRLIFGNPQENVRYAHFIKDDLEKFEVWASCVIFLYGPQRDEMKPRKNIISDKLLRLKEAKLPGMTPEDWKKFVTKLRLDHKDILDKLLGTGNENQEFINGIFFSPSLTKTTVPHLQKAFMVDVCHLHFGKYMLFCCYGVTASSNILPVAFAIIIGNENTSSWRQFWKYVLV